MIGFISTSMLIDTKKIDQNFQYLDKKTKYYFKKVIGSTRISLVRRNLIK
jgi:hypothetical protein